MNGGWREVMDAGCLANTDMSGLIATVDHAGVPLGRRSAGTLQTEDGPNGLGWSVELAESRASIRDAVVRGDIVAGSWKMIVEKDRWDGNTRHIVEVRELQDVCVAGSGIPAYPDAAVEYRTEPEPKPAEPADVRPRPGGHLRVGDRTGGSEWSEERALLEIERAIMSIPPPAGPNSPSVDILYSTGETMEARSECRTLTDAITLAPTQLSTVLFDKLRPNTVMFESGIQVIDMPQAKAVVYPTISGDITPATYSEGAPLTPSDPTFSSITATARKIAGYTQIDNEVLEDSSPPVQSVLTNHFLKLFGIFTDKQLLTGNGTPPNITGLANLTGRQPLVAATNGQAITFDNIADAIALLEGLGIDTSEMAMVAHPRNKATLRKMKASTAGTYLWGDPKTNTPDTVFGVPLRYTTQLPTNEVAGSSGTVCNSLYLFAKTQVYYVRRQALQLQLDRSVLFANDQSALRGTQRGDLIVPNPTAVVQLSGLTS